MRKENLNEELELNLLEVSLIQLIKNLIKEDNINQGGSTVSDKKKIESFSEAKIVNKPWGFELWLSDGTKTPYAFKIIYIKAGTKTSLQFHNEKTEHNCLVAGKIKFHYENPITQEIETKLLSAGHVITVHPPAIHRVEALTDIILFEASTAHLDDVVRIDDDYQRTDGKIESEHQK